MASSAPQESRLATIALTEVVDFTAKLATDRERTLNLLYQDFQIMIQLCEQFDAQVLKCLNDGLLIYFPSALNAVNCAQEIQVALRQASESTPVRVLTHRIGIHFDDVVFQYSDIIGTGVKIAARAQAEALPGGICISQAVYEAVRTHLPLQVIELGSRQFEGIEEPIPLYQLTF